MAVQWLSDTAGKGKGQVPVVIPSPRGPWAGRYNRKNLQMDSEGSHVSSSFCPQLRRWSALREPAAGEQRAEDREMQIKIAQGEGREGEKQRDPSAVPVSETISSYKGILTDEPLTPL